MEVIAYIVVVAVIAYIAYRNYDKIKTWIEKLGS